MMQKIPMLIPNKDNNVRNLFFTRASQANFTLSVNRMIDFRMAFSRFCNSR